MGIFLSGVLAGVMSGLAMGGGVILIAILTYITTYSQASLQSVNLIYYIPTAIFSAYIYAKEKNVDFKIVAKIVLWGIVPTIICAIIANKISTEVLQKMFACYLIIVGFNVFKTSLKNN